MRKINLLRQNRSEIVSHVYRSKAAISLLKDLIDTGWTSCGFGSAPRAPLVHFTQNLRSGSFVLFFLPKLPPDDAINTLVPISFRYLVNFGSDLPSSKFISE